MVRTLAMMRQNHNSLFLRAIFFIAPFFLFKHSVSMRAFISWSGGKDCTLALHHFLSNPQNKACYLVHFQTEESGISKHHRFGKDVFDMQSDSLDIPLLYEEVTAMGYEHHLKSIIDRCKSEGIYAGVFGDIFLEEHRAWIERICKESNITALFPLWGMNTLSAVRELCNLGYKARVTGTREEEEFLPLKGMDINNEFIQKIQTIEGADPCGEKGEYHTMAYDGPLFKKIISIIAILLLLLPGIKLSAENFRRIISLTPSVTQSIYYLGAREALVGCTSYCHIAKKDGVEIVSSAIKPNLEKIAALKPDLVLASGMISERDINTLRRLGIKVEILSTPKSYEEICTQFAAIGKLTGKEHEANQIIKNSRERVNSVYTKMMASGKRDRFFIQIGAAPIYTVIPHTFMDDYIKFSYGENIACDLESGTIGREFVVARDPDYIFIVTMGIVGKNEESVWRGFKNLKAVRKNKIFILESEQACQPTPVTFAETLEIINKYISEK